MDRDYVFGMTFHTGEGYVYETYKVLKNYDYYEKMGEYIDRSDNFGSSFEEWLVKTEFLELMRVREAVTDE